MILKHIVGPEVMAQGIYYLLCKHEYPSLVQAKPDMAAKPDTAAHVCNPNAAIQDGEPVQRNLCQKP